MRANGAFASLVGVVLLWGSSIAHGQAISETSDEISYRMRNGDSLIGLSRRYMIGPDSHLEVQRLNRITNPDRLPVGRPITIPTRLLRSTPMEAQIVAFRGTVRISNQRPASAAAIGLPIKEGATIETGDDGYVTLGLANGSRMSLPSKSRVRITRMRKYNLTSGTDFDFEIDKGRSEISVTPQPDPRNRFRLRTPIAVSAVRGTVFRIGYSGMDEPSLTEVIEGNVAVTAGTTRSAILTGFGAAAAQSGAVKEEKLLAPPLILEPTQLQRDQMLTFTLAPNAKAVGYHVQVATDPKFMDIVGAGRTQTNTVAIDSLTDGIYFVRTMAIAPSGLEGLFETFQFKRALKTLVTRPSPGKSGVQNFSWGAVGAAGNISRLQVFDARRLDLPLIDETGLDVAAVDVVGLTAGDYVWRVGTLQTSGGSAKQVWTPYESLRIPD